MQVETNGKNECFMKYKGQSGKNGTTGFDSRDMVQLGNNGARLFAGR